MHGKKEYLKENRNCWRNSFVLCRMTSVKAVYPAIRLSAVLRLIYSCRRRTERRGFRLSERGKKVIKAVTGDK